MEDLRDIWGPSGRVDSGVDSGSILGHSGAISGPLSEKPHEMTRIDPHLAVGRALWLNMY